MRQAITGEAVACAGLLSSMVDGRTVTLTFAADGTYTQVQSAGTLAMTMTYTKACYAAQNSALLTPELCAAMSKSGPIVINNAPVGSSTISCAMAGENCVCDWVMSSESVTLTGTYTTDNSTLTMADSGGQSQTVPSYCVDGNTLKLGSEPGDALVVYVK
jgi:hypothetical protein